MINNQNIGVLSEKVARLESDVKTLALPPVETTDEGKALVVNASGKWEAANAIPEVINALDSTSETAALSAAQGKALNAKISNIGGEMVEVHISGTTDANGILETNLSAKEYIYVGTDLTASFITLAVNALSDQKIRVNIRTLSDLAPVANANISDNFYFWKLN